MLTPVRFRPHFMHWAINLLPNIFGSNETVHPMLAVVICHLGERMQLMSVIHINSLELILCNISSRVAYRISVI
jgi:hypothetical protein